jgi:trehalose synthase-fused probable maltokinase
MDAESIDLGGSTDPWHTLTLAHGAAARYVAAQRWFGQVALAGSPALVAVAPLAPDVAWAQLVTGRGTFNLPLALVDPAAPPARGVIARLTGAGAARLLVDATHHGPSCDRLGEVVRRGGRWAAAGGAWVASPCHATRPEDRGPLGLPAGRLMTAEQSNSSVRFGDVAMLKLYRRLEPGPNPDLEIAAYLAADSRAPAPPVAPVFSALRFVPEAGEAADAGMLQAFVPNRGDGWQHLLDTLRPGLADADAGAEPGGLPGAVEAEALGRQTRLLHDRLGAPTDAPAFAPEATGPADVRAWISGIRSDLADALQLFDSQMATGRVPAAARFLAGRVLAAAGRGHARLDAVAAILAAGAGAKIRHHGDLHLGQVLCVRPDAFVFLDFEGEPLRPLAERRRKHSALRDVAGMVRSFAYAAATAGADAPQRAEAWRQAATAAYLRAYGLHRPAPYLPPTAAACDALLDLFVLEKAFYELRYELNHRPGWVGIPARGILAALGEEAP